MSFLQKIQFFNKKFHSILHDFNGNLSFYSSFGFSDPVKLQMEVEKIIRSNGEAAITRLDRMMKNELNELTSKVNKDLLLEGLVKPFPKNCLSLMTTTGAKGSTVSLVFSGDCSCSGNSYLIKQSTTELS